MEQFREACGVRGPLQVSVEHRGGRQPLRRVTYQQPFLLLGRDPRCDLALDDGQVSPFHAYLQVIGGQVFWVDLASSLRTRGPLESTWLESGQAVRVEPYVVRLDDDGADEEPPPPADNPLAPPAEEPDGMPTGTLDLLNRAVPRPPRRIRRALTLVGSSPESHVRLIGPSVSDFHCALLRTAHGLFAVSLCGRGGIGVNNSGIRWAGLEDRDRLQVGRFQFGFRYDPPPAVLGTLRRPGKKATALKPLADPLSVLDDEDEAADDTWRDSDRAEALWLEATDRAQTVRRQIAEEIGQASSALERLIAFHEDEVERLRRQWDRLQQVGASRDGVGHERDNSAFAPVRARPTSMEQDLPEVFSFPGVIHAP